MFFAFRESLYGSGTSQIRYALMVERLTCSSYFSAIVGIVASQR
ncbi:hypothetical protein [Nocardia yunnanensis]|nr:hypothetical protein [Nocardia yunnanensis]